MIVHYLSLFLSILVLASFSESESHFSSAGYKNILHPFETVVKRLTPELERDYELFIFINTVVGPTPRHALIPSQYMLVVGKTEDNKNKLLFERSKDNIITGVKPDSLGLSQIISAKFLEQARRKDETSGLPIAWENLEVLPISSGASYSLPTFSGIFQMNWQRSESLRPSRRSYKNPMSNAIYIGYFYHPEAVPRKDWNPSTRSRVSHAAIHGSPSDWHLLGRARSSLGCARLRPSVMEGLYEAILEWPEKSVLRLNWDYELPDEPPRVRHRAKPVLILLFNGYETTEV